MLMLALAARTEADAASEIRGKGTWQMPSTEEASRNTHSWIPIFKIGIPSAIFLAWRKIPNIATFSPARSEIMILQSLRLKPMHGYALVKHIKQVSDDLLQVEEGSLYPALQRMLKEGWLEVETGISAKGRPTRIYRLTDAGIRHLEREVVSFEKMFAGITRVLAAAKA